MRKLILFAFSIVVAMTAMATEKIVMNGLTYELDTLFHAQVGPGTTQTSLILSGANKLRVFYLTIDLTVPGNSLRCVSGNDMVAGNELTSSMAQRHTRPGEHYFAGVNGDFFYTSGTAANGASIVGTPSLACIVDDEFIRTSNDSKQFAVDVNGVMHIGQAYFYNSTITIGDKKARTGAVNLERCENNMVNIFTPKYYGCSNQPNYAGKSWQVSAKLADGEQFKPGRKCKFVVTSEPDNTGNMTMTGDMYVIFGAGNSVGSGCNSSALDFVGGLHVGDVVEVDSRVTMFDYKLEDGKEIVPMQMVGGNPRSMGYGEVLDTEGERGDASARHPRTSIGYNADRTKCIMMVIDGRSSISAGVRTSEEGYLMKWAGASDAINLDGGGSSTLYTSALGIRNVPSDGHERADGNAIFVVTSNLCDNEVASISFHEWAMKFPQNGVYVPKFFAYNKCGVMVSTDLQGVTLSCDPALGHIINGNTFVGSGNGTHALTATYNGITTTIPVTIVQTDKVVPRLESVILDDNQPYTAEVLAAMGETLMPISAAALTWSSDDSSIASIDASTGDVTVHQSGETAIHGVIGETEVTINLNVQIPEFLFVAADPKFDASTYTLNQTGGTGIAVSPIENTGIQLDYTGASGRSPYIKVTHDWTFYSRPSYVRMVINPGDAVIKSISYAVNANHVVTTNVSKTLNLKANEDNIIDLSIGDFCDAEDFQNYPINMTSFTFNMGTSTSGKAYSIKISELGGFYDWRGGAEKITVDSKSDNLKVYPTALHVGEVINVVTDAKRVNLFSIDGKVASMAESTNGAAQIQTSGLGAGVYVIAADGKSAKIVIR